MKRSDIIEGIMKDVKDELVIASTGMISREVCAAKDRPENFYVTGSMGTSLGIGIGLALHTEKNVMVIAGDGDILMSLGTLVLYNKLNLPNLQLIILDNNCYASTGGQKTCSDSVEFNKIAPTCNVFKNIDPGKGDAPRIELTPAKIAKRFYNAVNHTQ